MRYSLTLRTYNPDDCTSTGIRIRANRTTLSIETRTCWAGSRTAKWTHKCDDALSAAKELHKLALEIGNDGALEHWGFTDGNAKLSGVIR